MSAQPIAFCTRPLYVAKPWGGRRLETVLGRADLPAGPVGECWEIADLPEAASRVEGGPLDGATLREALGAAFPLLVKVIDAREDLSVQVHPDGISGPPAKEEAWVALAGGGAVAAGVARSVQASAPWLARLERRDLRGPGAGAASPPTLVHVPAGTVHAILAGSLVWEVQTPVDITWRLDDYGRQGLDGKPRALHLSEAATVLARGPESFPRVDPGGRTLVGRRLRVDLHPPGVARVAKACCAFLPAGGTVRGAQPAGDVLVPAGRSVVLTPAARTLHSTGWVFTAAALT